MKRFSLLLAVFTGVASAQADENTGSQQEEDALIQFDTEDEEVDPDAQVFESDPIKMCW